MDYTIQEISLNDQKSLDMIGRFRFDVWQQETTIDAKQFPNGIWLEPLDYQARHWMVTDHENVIIGAARLTVHQQLGDNPDGYLWKRADRMVPEPVGHLCKLVVHEKARGQGIGRKLNQIRIQAAQEMGMKSIIVTASEKNARLLLPLGFVDTAIREIFSNRPEVEFIGLELVF